MTTYLTRRVTFDAAHRYWRAGLERRRESACVRLVPTCENLARFIAECVQRALGREATLTAVHVAEDATISATHQADQGDMPGR